MMETNNKEDLTAEEIRAKHLIAHGLSVTNINSKIGQAIHNSALEAMEEYAAQQCASKDKELEKLNEDFNLVVAIMDCHRSALKEIKARCQAATNGVVDLGYLESKVDSEINIDFNYNFELSKLNERVKELENEVKRLVKDIEDRAKRVIDLASENSELKEAVLEFCNRVEKGEVRSTYTYNKFKKLLKWQ